MSVIEAVTVTLYRVKGECRPKGWRRKPRRRKVFAYRDAAWAKMRLRCQCSGDGPDRKLCRYHDRGFRAVQWGEGSYDEPPYFGFMPPAIWGLPRDEEEGVWDYGRAVAYRLARFYRHLDESAETANSSSKEG